MISASGISAFVQKPKALINPNRLTWTSTKSSPGSSQLNPQDFFGVGSVELLFFGCGKFLFGCWLVSLLDAVLTMASALCLNSPADSKSFKQARIVKRLAFTRK